MAFGGRGFLKIAADTSGYRDLQGALEFGGALSFDIAVASGGLYVMAGIYFRITPGLTDVSGFIRAGGCLNVLGLIHASVEFLLMMKYLNEGGNKLLYGIARVTVSIDLFLFSFDVTITMEKRIAGGSGGSSSTAFIDGRRATRLAAAESSSPAAADAAPQAYFERKTAPGRFKSVEKWNTDYWSQFAV
jgi:hypothetical protein